MPGQSLFPDIVTPRLRLCLMQPAVLAAVLAGDLEQGGRLLGATIPAELLSAPTALRFAEAALAADPLYAPWSARALILADGAMAGLVRFHSRPDPEYLRALAPGSVEIGYRVFAAYRRSGYAIEAVRAAMAWAGTAGIHRFVASIAPANVASLQLVERLGFVRIGEQIDEADGVEHLFLLEAAP